jgi:hypothetical protein
MKAWEDVTKRSRSTYLTINSEWYIDRGVKIERFTKDGRIVIKNTMTYTDNYDDITPEQLHIFTNMGWEAGVVMVGIETNNSRIDYYNNVMRHAILDNNKDIIESTLRKREELLKKNVDFRLEFNKLLSTL